MPTETVVKQIKVILEKDRVEFDSHQIDKYIQIQSGFVDALFQSWLDYKIKNNNDAKEKNKHNNSM